MSDNGDEGGRRPHPCWLARREAWRILPSASPQSAGSRWLCACVLFALALAACATGRAAVWWYLHLRGEGVLRLGHQFGDRHGRAVVIVLLACAHTRRVPRRLAIAT